MVVLFSNSLPVDIKGTVAFGYEQQSPITSLSHFLHPTYLDTDILEKLKMNCRY